MKSPTVVRNFSLAPLLLLPSIAHLSIARESGVDATAENKFPGADVTYGSAASGAGDNRDIPTEEGGGQQRGTGRMTKAGDFDQGEAGMGPDDLKRRKEEEMGGEDDVRGNIRNQSK